MSALAYQQASPGVERSETPLRHLILPKCARFGTWTIIALLSLCVLSMDLPTNIVVEDEGKEITTALCRSTFHLSNIPPEERQFLLFTAPKLFSSVPDNLKVWSSSLKGIGHLIIMSNDEQTIGASIYEGISTMCVEHTIDGFPRFDLMMAKMHLAQEDGIVAFANSDIEISAPSMSAIVSSLLWLGTKSLALLLPQTFSQPYNETGSSTKFWFAAMNRWDEDQEGLRKIHDVGGYDLWAWNVHRSGPSLLPYDIPPFRFPLATYDNWLLDVVNKATTRNVIDITDVAQIIHKDHSRKNYYQMSLLPDTGFALNKLLGLDFNIPNFNRDGLYHINRAGIVTEAPYFISVKNNNEFTLNRREIYSSMNGASDSSMRLQSEQRRKKTPPLSSHFHPFLLKNLLRTRSTTDGFVLLVSFTLGHRYLLLNFICNLNRVGTSSEHLVIAALSQEAYEWAVIRGLPVFLLTNTTEAGEGSDTDHFSYGSQGFRSVTKMKSRASLEILRAGLSLVYSDLDITWFQDPLTALKPYMKNGAGLTIQSNAPFHPEFSRRIKPHASVDSVLSESASNGYERLNSGLYVAPFSPLMMLAFTSIVSNAAKGSGTEQPYFYHTLCNKKPSMIVGEDSCEYRPGKHQISGAPAELFLDDSLPVRTLSRFSHPNGAVMLGPQPCNIYCLGKKDFEKYGKVEVVSAHNNWVVDDNGAKLNRQTKNGWWYLTGESCSFTSS